jgi:hypothetical protein
MGRFKGASFFYKHLRRRRGDRVLWELKGLGGLNLGDFGAIG